MTKTEAEKEVAELNEKAPDWYCPLARCMCRKDCRAFQRAFFWSETPEVTGNLVDIKKDDFHAQDHYCGNGMFEQVYLECPHGNDD